MNNAPQNWNCPPLMSDGRQPGTDYRPSCEVHDLIIKQNGLINSYDYRQFMINNACTLMDMNRGYYENKNQCDTCRFYHVDPNNNDLYWDRYTNWMGYKRNFTDCPRK